MDLLTIMRIARARWKIVVPILLVTFIAAAMIYKDKTTSYAVTGTELLVAGRGQATEAGEVAVVSADLLDELLMQPPILRQLTAEELSTTYDLELSETGTTLHLEVIGASAEQAVDTAARLVELAPDLLEESLGETDAGSVTIEQATTGSPDDAEPVGDGTFRYSTVIVVGPAPRVTLNPFPASLATVRSLVAVAESLPFLVTVSEAGADAAFEVVGNVREAPLIDVAVSSASPDEAIESHEIIVSELQNELDDLQAGALIDAEARTQMLPLVDATYPIATATSQVRPVAAIVVLGSGLAVGLATLLEAFAADRRRRRALTAWSRRVCVDRGRDSTRL